MRNPVGRVRLGEHQGTIVSRWYGDGEVKTPPFSADARLETGILLGRIQEGHNIGLPHSRPMPSIGKRCHELPIPDEDTTWRIVYRIDADAILILEVFNKTTGKTPSTVIDACKERIKRYDEL